MPLLLGGGGREVRMFTLRCSSWTFTTMPSTSVRGCPHRGDALRSWWTWAAAFINLPHPVKREEPSDVWGQRVKPEPELKAAPMCWDTMRTISSAQSLSPKPMRPLDRTLSINRTLWDSFETTILKETVWFVNLASVTVKNVCRLEKPQIINQNYIIIILIILY